MATQEAAIAAVQGVVASVAGIKGAPSYPPENIRAFPFSVCFPGSGEHQFSTPEQRKFLGEIVIEIHVARGKLELSTEAVMSYGDSIPNALMLALKNTSSPTGVQAAFQAAIETFGSITQEFSELDWGDVKTIGWRFVMNGVKIHTAIV